MKFLADENFPYPSASLIMAAGHDVPHVGLIRGGAQDAEIISLANEQERTILTFDSDFGTLVFRDHLHPSQGIIYFRLTSYQPEGPGRRLLELLDLVGMEELLKSITVVDDNAIRSRPIRS